MNLKAAGLPCRTLSTTYVITTAEVYQVGDGLGASHGCMHGRYPLCRGSRLSGPAHIADSASSGVQFAGPRSTAVQYSNAIDFERASLPSNAQIRAPTRLVDRHAPSSQRGGQGFESPQLHPRPEARSRLQGRGLWLLVQQRCTAVRVKQRLPTYRSGVCRGGDPACRRCLGAGSPRAGHGGVV